MTQGATHHTLRARLLAVEAAHAARPALWVEDHRLSYQQLFADARALASQIDATSDPGLPVGLYCQRDRISLVGILAAVLSGRPYVPLNPGFPPERLAAIIGIARPGTILCSGQTRAAALELLPELSPGIALFDETGLIGRGHGAEFGPKDDPTADMAEPTAYMMFTSGTTGTPKGVRVLERNVLAYLDGTRRSRQSGPVTGPRSSSTCPLTFRSMTYL